MNSGEVHRYKIVVQHKEYTIMSDESEDHIKKATALVNGVLESLAQTKCDDPQKVAILSALQLASKLLHAEQQVSLRKEREEALALWLEAKFAALP